MSTDDLLTEANERLDRIEYLCSTVRTLLNVIQNGVHDEPACPSFDNIDLRETSLLPKTRNALLRRGFKTVGQVRSLSERQLLGIPNIGSCAINDIKSTLAEYGLELPRMDYRG